MNEKFLEGLQQMIVDGVVEGTVEGITEELNKAIKGTTTVNEKPFMNKKETADYLGISFPTLRKWEKAGLKPSLIGGTHYLYDKEEVVKFIKERNINYLNN